MWQAAAVVGATLLAFAAMVWARVSAETSLGVALAVLVMMGVLDVNLALAGFANEQLHTIALLFVAAAALRRSGSLSLVAGRLFGPVRSLVPALVRLTLPVALLSSVLNNTPIVAMLIPEVRAWARRTGIAPSRLLIPLSYAAILGGLLTIIGTSTNLVVNGLVTEAGLRPLGFLEIGRIGAPVALIGMALLFVAARWLLPDHADVDAAFSNPHAFTTEILIESDGPYAGKRLADVQVDELPRLAPVEIQRGSRIIPAPRSDHVLQAGDRLVFAGPVASLLSLRQKRGLTLAPDHAFDETAPERHMAELLISDRCPLVEHRVGDGSFRRRYNAAVVAVARHGERVPNQRMNDWVLQPGDIVLVEVGADFLEQHRFNADFYLVTPRGSVAPESQIRAWLGLGILLVMVLLAAVGVLSMFKAALCAVAALLVFGFLDREILRESLDVRVLLTIALSFGIGAALVASGAAALLGSLVTRIGDGSPWLALAVCYVVTSVLTEVITNNAAAAIMVPLSLAVAKALGVSHVPFVAATMVGASASFATPLGYATNLMVYGPGGYKVTDFMRAGIPMNLAVGITTIALTPVLWPF